MKLTIFHSEEGDCLLLTSQAGKKILVDGGTSTAFKNNIAQLLPAAAAGKLDLVCVSHIDSDHIGGVLLLLEDLVAWRQYDYQVGTGNAGFPHPASPRPPEVKAIWHNGFKDMVGDNSAAIQDQLVANLMVLNADVGVVGEAMAAAAPGVSRLATSIRESLVLSSRAGMQQLGLQVNAEFDGRTILTPAAPAAVPFGDLQICIIGPSEASLTKLRQDWNKWLQNNQQAVEKIRRDMQEEGPLNQSAKDTQAMGAMAEAFRLAAQLRLTAAELGNRKLVTPPNLASLMFLVKEDGKTVLMTGDGHYQDILDGLRQQNLLDVSGRLHLDVLKVQHHGSEHNIHPDFCKAVTADHYVFCGNGANLNPDLDVLQTILDSRLTPGESPLAAGRPFKFWFSCRPSQAGASGNIGHLQQVQALVKAAAAASGGRLKVRLPSGGKLVLTL
jgi:hypothetical protein